MCKGHQIAATLAVALLLVVAGCGCRKSEQAVDTARNVGEAPKLAQGRKATFDTENGEMQAEATPGKQEGEGTTKITGADGKQMTTHVGKEVDTEALGIELYPGATVENAITMQDPAFQPELQVAKADLTTSDPFDKVAKVYKDKYPDAVTTETPAQGKQALMLSMGSWNDLKMVLDTVNEGKTHIALVHQFEKKNEG